MASELELGRQVCFALYAASRAVTQLYRPVLDALGLTYPQYLVMLVLWEQGQTTVKALSTTLNLDSGTLSPLLKRLEAAGLVTRRRRADDERSVEVRLTDDGATLRERATTVPRKIAGATGMEAAELETLRRDLTRLTETVSAQRLTPDEP
ncbi:MarR family transcriptional regulator [Actinophytocola sp.]|jgi:DNA-binding MarR family transcriptional regulator|uniref:MarR family winged helix-turn-helix transcriptional regulator n=1 Tax=Actinophytocola sp. TaxID=1872138 RepID=UPI002ED8EB0C